MPCLEMQVLALDTAISTSQTFWHPKLECLGNWTRPLGQVCWPNHNRDPEIVEQDEDSGEELIPGDEEAEYEPSSDDELIWWYRKELDRTRREIQAMQAELRPARPAVPSHVYR